MRETGMHWETLKKILEHPLPSGYQRRKAPKKPKIDPYLYRIQQILEGDKLVPKKQRHTVKRIWEALQEEGFTGGYTIVKDAVRELRRTMKEVYIPLIHRPGEAQVDFGHAVVKMSGVLRKTCFFVMALPYSDAFFVRAQRRQQGIAPATANRELRTLKRVFNIAVARGYLAEEENPCRALSAIKVTRKRPPYCSPEQFAALYDRAPDAYWKAFVTTLYCTRLRLQEMLNLTWNDIDFEQGAVHVTRKDRHDMIQAWQPKDHEMRTIPLPSQATGLLATWRSQAAEDCPYVFMVPQRWDYYRAQMALGRWRDGQDLVNNILRRFKTLCRRAGIGSYSLHDMRRSCMTNWARDLPIHVVQQLAGHSDMRTTQKYYLSVNEEDVEKAERLQGRLLAPIGDGAKTDPLLTHWADFRGYRTRRPGGGKSQHAA